MKHSKCICSLVSYNASLLLAHWQADTVTNEHKTLGDLYDDMVYLVDDFAEVVMGKYGLVDSCDGKITTLDNPTAAGLEVVKEAQGEFTVGEDDDVLNILADMSAALNKAAYLLKSGTTSVESKDDDVEEFSTKEMPE